MTKIDAAARHRATPVRSNPLQDLAKAVSANAGTVGRQAAVLTAASGLVLTFGLPAQGAPSQEAARAAQTVEKPTTISPERVSVAKPIKVTAAKAKKSTVKRDDVTSTSTPAPTPEPAVEVEEVAAEPAQEAVEQAQPQQQQANEQAQERAPQQQAPAQPQQRTQAPAQQSNTQSSNTQQASSNNQSQQAQISAAAAQPAASAVSSNGLVAAAMRGVGAPYVLGGGSPAGWDCSGFTAWVYAQNGISIPRTTWGIRASSQFQRVSSPQPGDLVIQNGGGHVVVYIGGGQAVGAQNPSVGTIVQSVNRNPIEGYYRYVG